MHNSLRESFNSHRSKTLLTLAILATTSGALFSDLNAQTPNNGANPKMEQVDKKDAKIVADFTKPLGVTIPAEWTKFASDIIQMLDAEGVASAQMILNQDLPKVAQADKAAYTLMALEAIQTAYDKEKHTKASDEFFAEYLNYENGVKSVTSRFAEDWNKRSEIIIAQNKQETNQMKQEIAQNNKTSEELMLKTYKMNPNSEKLKTLAKETKQAFDKTGYKYSTETAKMFAQLGIK